MSAAAGSYTRTYGYGTGSNRLATTQIGSSTPYTYSHDSRGNMIVMPHLSVMDYDLLNQMHHITAGSVEGYYQYSGGQRVRKYLDKGSNVTEERIYFGNYEVYRKWTGTTLDVERTTLHAADDTGRIAMLEKRTQGSDGSLALLKRFIYSNHLQSAALELDDTGAIISYEEYHPFGTTAYQANNSAINAVAKRYRFTGKERDEESGLNYHGARYYMPWLCRWSACDPLESKYSGLSAYNYCLCSPTNYIDVNGRDVEVSLKDNSITFSSIVYVDASALVNKSFTQEQADKLAVQKAAEANEAWSKFSEKSLQNRKYSDPNDNYKNYNVNLNMTFVAVTPANRAEYEKASKAKEGEAGINFIKILPVGDSRLEQMMGKETHDRANSGHAASEYYIGYMSKGILQFKDKRSEDEETNTPESSGNAAYVTKDDIGLTFVHEVLHDWGLGDRYTDATVNYLRTMLVNGKQVGTPTVQTFSGSLSHQGFKGDIMDNGLGFSQVHIDDLSRMALSQKSKGSSFTMSYRVDSANSRQIDALPRVMDEGVKIGNKDAKTKYTYQNIYTIIR